jgi:uncharacterized protein (TIGR02677 family)
MDITSKLIKPITETKYLTAENCRRYRPILRYFFLQYEKIRYWMYKEEVYEALKDSLYFEGYTIEQCRQDLDVLVEWGNLIPMQDTSRAATVEEFKNKQFRYQLSEYSVEIERLTTRLENISVEGASLEPTLFERLKEHVLKIPDMADADVKTAGVWWRDLSSDFKRLNQNYQDYMRSFHSIHAEELMKSREFIAYKDSIIEYLREFVKGLQRNAPFIEETLRSISQDTIHQLINKAFEYEKSIPRMDMEITESMLYDNIAGRWESFRDWFLGGNGRDSEAARLLEITNDIIRKITRYAAQIAESRNSAANRKEEYKKLCSMFLSCKDMDEAHMLSSLAFGIFHTKHIQAGLIRETESINSSVYDEKPAFVEIKPRIRTYREKSARTGIPDKTGKKAQLRQAYIKNLEQEKAIMDGYISNHAIAIAELPVIPSHVRITLLKWIEKAFTSPDRRAKTEDGRVIALMLPSDGKRCTLMCEDGQLEMPAYILRFEKTGQGAGHERA